MSELVRLAWDPDRQEVAVDSGRRLGGRGAWVHPDRHCGELAVTRRAVVRALRIDAKHGQQVSDLMAESEAFRGPGPAGDV